MFAGAMELHKRFWVLLLLVTAVQVCLAEEIDEYSTTTLAYEEESVDSEATTIKISTRRPELQELFDTFWEWRLRESPEFATQAGVHDFDTSLAALSLSDHERRYETCKTFLQEIHALEGIVDRKSSDYQHLTALKHELQTYIDGYKHMGFVFPLSYIEGIHLELEKLAQQMPTTNFEEMEKLVKRYLAIPRHINETIDIMREGVRQGKTFHQISMDGIQQQLADLQVSVLDDSPLLLPFVNFKAKITEKSQYDTVDELFHRAKYALRYHVLPSFARLSSFIGEEYSKSVRKTEGVSTITGGREFYQQCLKFHTETDYTPEDIHMIGLKEVQRIEGLMNQIITDELGLNMTTRQFTDYLRKEDRFHFTKKEDIIKEYKEIIAEIDKKLPQLFLKSPKGRLELQFLPESMNDAPIALYEAGSPDDSRPSVFYLNGADIRAHAKYEMRTLALHEANPGHHLQIDYRIRHLDESEYPAFRRNVEDRVYSIVPSRFPMHTAFIEGWGLYAEYLGLELGVFKTPYDKYGHYSKEIFRACRLVVDTGLHALGWTREQAVQYMLEHTASSEFDVKNDVNRYITWPGQACAYKVGQMKIQELRRKSAAALGSKFDVRQFHEVLLKCAGPFLLIENCVNEYISSHNADAQISCPKCASVVEY